MQQPDIIRGSRGWQRKMSAAFLARIKRSMQALAIRRKPKAPAVARDDWYRMNAAARAEGEFWAEMLLWWGLRR